MCFEPGLVKNTLGPSGIRTHDLPITSKLDALPTELQATRLSDSRDFPANPVIGGHGGTVLFGRSGVQIPLRLSISTQNTKLNYKQPFPFHSQLLHTSNLLKVF